MPVHALLRCIIAAELLSIQESMLIGETENSRTLWDAAAKVRGFVDAPRGKDHRAELVAKIHQLRDEMRGVTPS
jgi:hypothetical protein